jgi:hypothetical protein
MKWKKRILWKILRKVQTMMKTKNRLETETVDVATPNVSEQLDALGVVESDSGERITERKQRKKRQPKTPETAAPLLTPEKAVALRKGLLYLLDATGLPFSTTPAALCEQLDVALSDGLNAYVPESWGKHFPAVQGVLVLGLVTLDAYDRKSKTPSKIGERRKEWEAGTLSDSSPEHSATPLSNNGLKVGD